MANFPIGDFSGGITDSIFSSPENCSEVLDNWLIRKDRSIETAPGLEVIGRLPSNKRVSNYRFLNGSLLAFSNTRVYHIADNGTITEVTGPSGFKAFNLGNENSIVSVAEFNNHLICVNDAYSNPIKIYKDGSNNIQLRTAGLPLPSTDPTITTGGSKNYVYALVFSYEHRVGNTLFQDLSAPRYISRTGVHDTSVTLGALPSISNGSDLHHDVTAIRLKIYRTLHNGSSFYYVGDVLNGATSFVDTVTDAVLATRPTLYTNGGILPNDAPPRARYIFEANDTYNYLDIVQNNEEKPHISIQSISNDPDSVPEGFFTEYKSPTKGGGAIGRSRIVFTQKEVIRLDGQLDELGRGTVGREVISNTIGCVSHNSIVKSSRGLYWASLDGFYFTDGFGMPTKLARKDNFSSKIDKIYKELVASPVQQSRIQGTYDSLNNRVYWTVQRDNADNDTIFVYDETHDAFSTLSFGTTGIMPTAILMDGEDIIIGDSKGYIFRMGSAYYTHPVINTTLPISDWVYDSIIYRWKSVALSLGDGKVNKWITKVNVQGNPKTNLTMAIRSYTNGEDGYKELYPVRIAPGLVWGDPAFTWGNLAFVWDRVGTLNQTRKFPSGRMRARHRQIELTNAYFTLQENTLDPDSFLMVDSALKTASLVDPAKYNLGVNNELYDLVIDGISYKILSGTESTLVLADPSNTLTDGAYTWQMKGYGKGQRAHVMNLSMEFEYLSDAGTFWQGGSDASA